MGAERAWSVPLSVHAFSTRDVGGTRMGTDPSNSVVDGDCRIHDALNVFVLGGSAFPTQSGLNPTLTMQAVALRTALHIAGTRLQDMRAKLDIPADLPR